MCVMKHVVNDLLKKGRSPQRKNLLFWRMHLKDNCVFICGCRRGILFELLVHYHYRGSFHSLSLVDRLSICQAKSPS